jgi:hypothetical protein
MILRRYLIGDEPIRPRQDLCELEVDGEIRVHKEAGRLGPADVGGIYRAFIAEGDEVPLSCLLLEFSDTVPAHNKNWRDAERNLVARRPRYPRVFLSYRREDSEPYAWRLHEALGSAWGEEDVFMDQFSIRTGEAWRWTVQQSAVHADAMIVLIGPAWLSIEDEGRRRLDNDEDLVRREIVAALDRGTLVAPILLPGAALPDAQQLPADMSRLLDLQFFEVSKRHWKSDVEELKRSIEAHFRDVLVDPIGV